MNIYVVTEGKVEAIVYRCWIPLVNPILSPIDYISDVETNNFLIYSSKGYPYYFDTISDAIRDINLGKCFDRLVVTVDSEDYTKQEKYNEINSYLEEKDCSVEVIIVIQHFCIETWALGNRKIIRTNTNSRKLKEYKKLHNVRNNDPELLPPKPDEGLTRAKFAEKYLRVALNDKFRNLTYSKRNPRALVDEKYFVQVKNRYEETSHISSFNDFLNAFN